MPRNRRLILIQGLMLAGFIVITFCAPLLSIGAMSVRELFPA